MSFLGIGVGLVVVTLLCVALSVRTNVELVPELRARDKTLYEKLGEPRLIGYEWVGLPGNRAYSAWVRDVAAADPASTYSALDRIPPVRSGSAIASPKCSFTEPPIKSREKYTFVHRVHANSAANAELLPFQWNRAQGRFEPGFFTGGITPKG